MIFDILFVKKKKEKWLLYIPPKLKNLCETSCCLSLCAVPACVRVCESSLLCCHSSRIAVFSVTVFYDERIVIVAEQRPDASEEDSFQWMSRVLQVNHIYFQCRLVSIFNQHFSFFMMGFRSINSSDEANKSFNDSTTLQQPFLIRTFYDKLCSFCIHSKLYRIFCSGH